MLHEYFAGATQSVLNSTNVFFKHLTLTLGLVLYVFRLFFLLGVDTAEEKPTSTQGSPDENSSELSTSGCIGGSETLSEADHNKGNVCLIGMSTLCSQKREGFISKAHDSLTSTGDLHKPNHIQSTPATTRLQVVTYPKFNQIQTTNQSATTIVVSLLPRPTHFPQHRM